MFDESIPCLEKATQLAPQHVSSHANLGFAYNEKRLYDKAIPCLKKVIKLDPNHATAYINLGHAYNVKGLHDEAIACLKTALKLQPKLAVAYNNLGFAYKAKGLNGDAIPCFKKCIELFPKSATAHGNLGDALTEVGDLEPARDAFKKALELTPQTAPNFKTRKQTLEQAESLLRLQASLADLVKEGSKPKNFEEGLQRGKVCRVKQHYRAALRYYEQAFASDPVAAKKLAASNLVVLARVAVLASAGQGSDPLPETDRPKYRAKALGWLQEFLKKQREALAKDNNAARYSCQRDLRALSQHKDLASVRPPALDNLAAEERKEWETFWSEVDALLEKADALPLDPSARSNP
jgi:tetratricopeptide (TPR) repeat protein